MTGAGEFDQRITFETATVTPGALGSQQRSWAPVATVWAKITPVNDTERWRAGQVEARSISWFRCLATSRARDITTRDRILYDGAYWSITGIKDAERRRVIEFTAERSDG